MKYKEYNGGKGVGVRVTDKGTLLSAINSQLPNIKHIVKLMESALNKHT